MDGFLVVVFGNFCDLRGSSTVGNSFRKIVWFLLSYRIVKSFH